MTTTPTEIPGVGPQLERAQRGDDPRGILTFEYLPDDLQRQEIRPRSTIATGHA